VLDIPPALEEQRELGREWGAWLDRLPGLARDLQAEWGLTQVAVARHGFCSLVLPVVTAAWDGAALKITFDGDDESLHESVMLQRWAGDGAVQLLRADPHRRALLLEWLDGPDLTDTWDLEACEVVAALYGRLHAPAPPQLRPLTSYVERWTSQLVEDAAGSPLLPPRLVAHAVSLARDLVSDPASVGVSIHGDLHYENVLHGERGWLAIDPKPMSGDPHYELAPMLWNRWDELAGDVQAGVRRRFHTLVDAAGLDEHRARDWVIVRMILNAGWTLQDAREAGRAPDAGEREWITTCLTLAKAVQD